MKRIVLSTVFALTGALAACPSDDTSNPTDTSVSTDTLGQPDSVTPTDTLGGNDTVTILDTTPNTPDVPMTPGTVKNLQAEAEGVGCNPEGIVTLNPQVSLSGVVVTTPKYDALTATAEGGTSLDGYYVADQDGGDWSGINIVIDRAEATNFVPGDVLDLQGELMEFYCFTQFKVTSFTVGTAVTAPAPLEVEATAVASEAKEGMLVKVTGVTVSEAAGGGTFRVTGGFLVDHDFDFFLSMDVGATYDVTGVVKWAYNEWRLMPRSTADVRKQGGGTETGITALQSLEASTACTASSIQNFATGLEITGVIASERFDAANTLHGYYLSDGTQDDYSGIYVVISKTQNTEFHTGDVVKVSGKHVEYYCLTELSADVIEASTAVTLTAPAAVVLDKTVTAADLEKYEGMLVTINNVGITGATDYNEATTDTEVLIDDQIMGTAFVMPASGSTLTSLTGFVTYGFSKYRIVPRTAADMVAAQ